MKKRTLKLAIYSLMMTAMLFNCKDKDSDPDAPDVETTKAITDVTVATATYSDPAEVTVVAGSVAPSAQAAAVDSDLDNVTAGNVPASVTGAASAVSGALSGSETATLSSLSSSTISQVAAGGAVPADLKAVLAKAMANPALAAYLPQITYPTINGVTLKGKRIATGEAVEESAKISGVDAVEKVDVSDACLAAAQALVDAKKPELDKSKTDQTAALETKYQTWIAKVNSDQTACAANVPSTATQRATAQTAYANSIAKLDGAKAALGDDLYNTLKSLSGLSLVAALSAYNDLDAANALLCTTVATAAKKSADDAKAAGTTAINTVYNDAIAKLNTAKAAALASCHNQGGGN